MEKVGGTWRKRSPENVAAESDFYIFTDKSGQRRAEIEEALGLLENAAARLLRRRVFRERLLMRHQRLELAAFVVAMLNRVPAQVENFREFLRETGRLTLKVLLEHMKDDPKVLQAVKDRYRRETGEEITIKPEDLDPDLYTVDVDRGAAVAGALAPLREVAAMVAAMGWTFFVSRTTDYFITSDFPVGLVDPVKQRRVVGLHPAHFPYVELTIPLSRSIALAAGWTKQDTTRFLDAPHEVIEQVNFRTAMRATVLYAPKLTFPGVGALISGDGCWASSPAPKPGVVSTPAKDGHLIGISMPSPWLPRGKPLRLTGE